VVAGRIRRRDPELEGDDGEDDPDPEERRRTWHRPSIERRSA